MFQNYPNIVSREELLNEIWDDESFVEENTLNVTISRIRKRLERIGSTLAVKTVRGVGYRIGDSRHEK
ncbi:winged helix-turn-helix domain-containing protein [Streptococcus sp.]